MRRHEPGCAFAVWFVICAALAVAYYGLYTGLILAAIRWLNRH